MPHWRNIKPTVNTSKAWPPPGDVDFDPERYPIPFAVGDAVRCISEPSVPGICNIHVGGVYRVTEVGVESWVSGRRNCITVSAGGDFYASRFVRA